VTVTPGAAQTVASVLLSLGGSQTLSSGATLAWNSDTGLSRISAALLAIGSGAAGSTAGHVRLASVQSAGTAFTLGGGCTTGTIIGGATAGTFVSSTTGVCGIVMTMGNSATAPNGWICDANNRTTFASFANVWEQTASSTTTATLTSTTVSGDVISIKCTGY